ncbi:MAG: hypothetical protein ACKOW3_10050, partial [Hyphomicrobium sp.]
ESTSQTLQNRPQRTTQIKLELERKLNQIPNLETRWVFAARPQETSQNGTNLFADLNAALRDVPPERIAGVFLITDGQIHDTPKSIQNIGFTAPIHTFLTGQPNEFDRRIEILKSPRYGIVGQKREVEFQIVESGKNNSDTEKSNTENTVSLKLQREGKPEEIKQIKIGIPIKIDMEFPHAGANILELEIEGQDQELTRANNRAAIVAEGVRENLRVLLISGKPHAGERTWRNLLKSDASVDLVHFTILRPPEKQDGTPINQLSLIAFPTKELFSDKINDFDLIIFDRYEHKGILQLNYYDNIARYVEKNGGALLVASGDDYAQPTTIFRTPLAAVLPARPTGKILEEPFKASITKEGQKHPVTQGLLGAGKDGMPPTWGRWFRQAEVKPERGKTILSGAQNNPLLILDRHGKGRVALLSSDQAWLWARGYESGGPYSDLLRRLSHWLMKEPDLEEERLSAEAKGNKIFVERHSMQEEVGTVELTASNGEVSQIKLEPSEPGIWRGSTEVKLPGIYKAQMEGPDGKLTAIVDAGTEDPREMRNVTTTDHEIKEIAQQSGGGIFWLGSQNQTQEALKLPRIAMVLNSKVFFEGSKWLGLKEREAFQTRGIQTTPLFKGFPALLVILTLVTFAWWREGR